MAATDVHLKPVFLLSSFIVYILVPIQAVCGDMRFTNDKPKDSIRASLGDNVPLRWSFTYNDDGKNSAGPWRARGVDEIIFGQWKSTYGEILFFEKIVAVDNGGNFTVRDGNKDKIDWSFSKYQLTFTIKNMALKDQAKYGVHVELGLDQSPLEHFVNVEVVGKQISKDQSTNVRNVSAYTSETVDILFTRSKDDSSKNFRKYEILKNDSLITLGKEKDGKNKFFCKDNTSHTATCKERFSFRYVNSSYVSFQIRNVTSQDAGLYFCQTYFRGVNKENDPQYEHVNLIVQGHAAVPTTSAFTTTSDHSVSPTSASMATSDHSGLQPCFIMLATITALQAQCH